MNESTGAFSSPNKTPSPTTRVAAKFIDLLVVFIAGSVLPIIVSPFLGVAYILLVDGFQYKSWISQSLGKKIFRIRTINRLTQKPADLKDSLIRNSPFGFAVFFGMIPIWGWLILIVIGVPLILVELFLLFKVETGQRLGDVMADTEVQFVV